jgi:hypothetical protein
VSVLTKSGGPLPTAVAVTVTVWPAVSVPLAGLTVSPVGPLIVNATGPPSAVRAVLGVAAIGDRAAEAGG